LRYRRASGHRRQQATIGAAGVEAKSAGAYVRRNFTLIAGGKA
jgi:hypothetical protein